MRDCTRLVAMGLLDTTGRGSRLAGSLGSELLARSFATGRSEERVSKGSDDEKSEHELAGSLNKG